MKKQEFKNLKNGDIVIINNGKNKGKEGIVRQINRSPFDNIGVVYLEPHWCEFEYTNDNTGCDVMRGMCRYNYQSINYPNKPHGKTFYIAEMFGEPGSSWSAENFTEDELSVIERFLNELNVKIEGKCVDTICIFNPNPDDIEE
jgi:hypothetical protein